MGCVWLHAHGGLRNLESRAVKAAEVSRVKEQLAAYSKENSKYKNLKGKGQLGKRENKRESGSLKHHLEILSF